MINVLLIYNWKQSMNEKMGCMKMVNGEWGITKNLETCGHTCDIKDTQ